MKRLTGIRFLLYLLFFLSFLTASAQVSVYIPANITVDPGEEFAIPIKVTGFQSIIGAQFSIKWELGNLTLLGIENMESLNLHLEDNFGLSLAAAEGIMAFAWSDNTLSGVTLTDSSTLFSLKFKAIGSADGFTDLQLWDYPAVPEFTDTSFTAIEYINHINNTPISVGSPSGTLFNSAPDKIAVQAAFPNPFGESTEIKIDVQHAIQAVVSIRNSHGQIIYEQERFLANGAQSLRFTKNLFTQTGTYYLQLRSPEFTVTQKMVFISH